MNKNNAPQPLYNAQGKPAGRIRQKNEETILAAAAEEFARYGFKGTSMNAIASRAGLPKANVHYYFNSKLGLYVEVMRHILELWDTAFDDLTVDDDPATALAEYIRIKMEFSRRHPQASKIFAMEVISGCECLSEHFNQDYRNWFRGRAAVFDAWIAAGEAAGYAARPRVGGIPGHPAAFTRAAFPDLLCLSGDVGAAAGQTVARFRQSDHSTCSHSLVVSRE